MRNLILFVCAIAVALTLGGCTNASNARHVLHEEGFKQVQITGYQFFGCGQDDSFHTGFKAVGPTGIPTSGVVCSGLFKNATVRPN